MHVPICGYVLISERALIKSERFSRSVQETHCSVSISKPVDINMLGDTP